MSVRVTQMLVEPLVSIADNCLLGGNMRVEGEHSVDHTEYLFASIVIVACIILIALRISIGNRHLGHKHTNSITYETKIDR